MTELDPEQCYDECLAKFDPEVAALARASVAWLRAHVPGSHQLLYDAYNALSVAFSTRPPPQNSWAKNGSGRFPSV
jgi:hypothetical protein